MVALGIVELSTGYRRPVDRSAKYPQRPGLSR